MDHVDSGFQDSFRGHWKTESFFGNIMNLDVYNVECGVYTSFFNKLIFFTLFFFFWLHSRHVEVLWSEIEPKSWQRPKPQQ